MVNASKRNFLRAKEKRRRLSAPPLLFKTDFLRSGREIAADRRERRAQRGADAGHRADRRNGDESCDEAILDGGCTLVVLNQLQKLGHVRSPVGSTKWEACSPTCA